MGPLDIAVIGCGTAGGAAALFLARAGYRVSVFEAVKDSGPVGAGIMVQPIGMRVLARLGLLERILERVLDESEFLSPYGVRSLSRFHKDNPFELRVGGEVHRVEYVSGESDSGFFGGNSNWRGPVWMPLNYLLLDALERYHDFYGDALTVEFPAG